MGYIIIGTSGDTGHVNQSWALRRNFRIFGSALLTLKIKSGRNLCNKRKISARSSARPLLPAAYAAGPEVRYYRGK